MRKVIRSFFFLILLGFFTAASAQLPPEVIADKYLVQAEQLFEKKDYVAALNMMDKILALQKEHNITLLEEFHFKYAQVAFSTGSFQIALDAVSKYLSAGRGSEFYKEALVLLIKIEEELEGLKVTPENMCEGKPVGSSCWMALINQPECYFWNPDLQKDETVTWSGACSDGFAQGAGTLVGKYSNDYWGAMTAESSGYLQNGKMYGQWDLRRLYGRMGTVIEKGPYVNGKRHGPWAFLYGESEFGDSDSEGPYVDDKRHGKWAFRDLDGTINIKETYVNGRSLGEQ